MTSGRQRTSRLASRASVGTRARSDFPQGYTGGAFTEPGRADAKTVPVISGDRDGHFGTGEGGPVVTTNQWLREVLARYRSSTQALSVGLGDSQIYFS